MTHARLGVLSRWYCDTCTTVRHKGRYACRFCCGYTNAKAKVVRGVKTVHGKPNSRSLP